MSDDEITEEGRQARFRQWEEIGLDRIKTDLINGGHQLVGGPPAVLRLAWEWVELKEKGPMPAKRDMDLIRDLLLEIEAGATQFTTYPLDLTAQKLLRNPEATKRRGEHLHLMQQAGLVEVRNENRATGEVIVRGLTWAGHDLLDSVRNPEIWAKTKKGAEAAGGFTVDLLKDLAKGFVKKQLEELTGVKL